MGKDYKWTAMAETDESETKAVSELSERIAIEQLSSSSSCDGDDGDYNDNDHDDDDGDGDGDVLLVETSN